MMNGLMKEPRLLRSAPLRIKLVNKSTHEVLEWRIRYDMTFKSICEKYMYHMDIDSFNKPRMVYNGRFLWRDDETPLSLNMNDGDIIEVEHKIRLRFSSLKYPNKYLFCLSVLYSTPLKSAMKYYAERHSMNENQLRFMYNGHRLYGCFSPQKFQMNDYDRVDVHPEHEYLTFNIKTSAIPSSPVVPFCQRIDVPLAAVLQRFADRMELPLNFLSFHKNGSLARKITVEDTLRSIGMKENDHILVLFK